MAVGNGSAPAANQRVAARRHPGAGTKEMSLGTTRVYFARLHALHLGSRRVPRSRWPCRSRRRLPGVRRAAPAPAADRRGASHPPAPSPPARRCDFRQGGERLMLRSTDADRTVTELLTEIHDSADAYAMGRLLERRPDLDRPPEPRIPVAAALRAGATWAQLAEALRCNTDEARERYDHLAVIASNAPVYGPWDNDSDAGVSA